MKKSLYIYLLLLVLTACSGSSTDEPTPVVPPTPEPPQVPVDVPMVFSPAASAASRADGTPMQDVHTAFKVWTYKHTSSLTTEIVMPGYHVKYLNDTDHWQYDGTTYSSDTDIKNQFLKFWDASANDYSFQAFAPAAFEGVSLTASGFTISDVTAHTADQSDIVVANHTRTIAGTPQDIDVLDASYTFPQLETYHDIVPLRFHHLLSKVTFKVINIGNLPAMLQNGTVSLTSGNTIYTTGDYVTNKWEFDPDDKTSQTLSAVMFSTPVALVTPGTKENATTLTSYYEFPQALTQGVSVSLKINDIVYEAKFDLPNTSWEFDKEYIYYIGIAVGDTTPILISLTLDEFEPGDKIKEQTQTNW